MEKWTVATDYLLGAVALAGSFGLARGASPGHTARRLWAAGFASVGAAAVLGGAWHARAARLDAPDSDALWNATLVAAALAGFFFVSGVAFASLARRPALGIAAIAAAKLGVFAVKAPGSDSFTPVIVDSALTLVGLAALQAVAFAKNRAPSARWVFAGVAVSAVGASVEAMRPDFSALGPDAIYHLVLIAGLVLFYRAGLLFEAGDRALPLPSNGPVLAAFRPIDPKTSE